MAASAVHPPEPPVDDVSIAIVNWNAGPLLMRCAEAALAAASDVMVVDNASTDGSADAVAAALPAVRVLRQAVNRGFAGGVNLASRAARSETLLLLNPDAVTSAGAVRRLRDTLVSTPEAAAVGACLVGEDGRPQTGFAVRRFPTLASWASDLLLVDDLWPGNPARRHYLAADLPLQHAGPYDVEQPAAACLLISREALRQVGGLDEAFYPAWFEDVDLCRRLRAAGFRVLYEPRAHVVHAGGVSLRSLDRVEFARMWYRNLRRYARKHHGRAANLALVLLLVLGMSMRTMIALLRGDTQGRNAWLAVLRDMVAAEPARATPG